MIGRNWNGDPFIFGEMSFHDTTGISAAFPLGKVCHIHTNEDEYILTSEDKSADCK